MRKQNEALIKLIFLAVKMTATPAPIPPPPRPLTVMLVRQTLLQLLLTDSHIVELGYTHYGVLYSWHSHSQVLRLFVLQSTRGLQKYELGDDLDNKGRRCYLGPSFAHETRFFF